VTANVHISVVTKGLESTEIDVIDNKQATYEGTIIMPDKFKDLLGDENARVSVSFNERMGGSHGFSSVGVTATVTINCDQSEGVISEAQEVAFRTAVDFADAHLGGAMELLEAHLSDYYRG